METKSIQQTIFFAGSPDRVYRILTDSELHSEMTGSPAKIGKLEGEAFEAWDGYILGQNTCLNPGKLIVQLWQADEEDWPKNHFSKVTIWLKEVEGGTQLDFFQEDVPASLVEHITLGWENFYWKSLHQMLAGENDDIDE